MKRASSNTACRTTGSKNNTSNITDGRYEEFERTNGTVKLVRGHENKYIQMLSHRV